MCFIVYNSALATVENQTNGHLFNNSLESELKSLRTKMLLLNTLGNSTPTDLKNEIRRFIFYEDIGEYSRSFIGENINPRKRYLKLKGLQIKSLHHWDFSNQQLRLVNLDKNALQKINDEETKFGNIHRLWLRKNQIKEVDLSNTQIEHLVLVGNELSNLRQQLFVSKNVERLYLGHNKIKNLIDYTFSAKRVYLNDNPISIISGILFQAVEVVSMRNCGLTLAVLQMDSLEFIARDKIPWIEWVVKENNITKHKLEEIKYRSRGIGRLKMILDDGEVYETELNQDDNTTNTAFYHQPTPVQLKNNAVYSAIRWKICVSMLLAIMALTLFRNS